MPGSWIGVKSMLLLSSWKVTSLEPGNVSCCLLDCTGPKVSWNAEEGWLWKVGIKVAVGIEADGAKWLEKRSASEGGMMLEDPKLWDAKDEWDVGPTFEKGIMNDWEGEMFDDGGL